MIIEDIKTVYEKADEIERKFSTEGPLRRFLEDFKLLIALVKDYWDKKYQEIPYWGIAAVVAALLYVLNPFDIIPDFIPFVGFLDDAAVVGICLVLIGKDLQKYKAWKERRPLVQ